jgi:hypothetical protein
MFSKIPAMVSSLKGGIPTRISKRITPIDHKSIALLSKSLPFNISGAI